MWTLKAARLVLLLLLFLSAFEQAFGRHTGQRSIKRNRMRGALGRGDRSEKCPTFFCPGDGGTQICCPSCDSRCGENIYQEKICVWEGSNWDLGNCSTRLCPSDEGTQICCPDCDYKCGVNVYDQKGCIKHDINVYVIS